MYVLIGKCTYAVFLTTVNTESYRVKMLVSPMEIVHYVAIISIVHAPEIEISQLAKIPILSRNYGSKEYSIGSGMKEGAYYYLLNYLVDFMRELSNCRPKNKS